MYLKYTEKYMKLMNKCSNLLALMLIAYCIYLKRTVQLKKNSTYCFSSAFHLSLILASNCICDGKFFIALLIACLSEHRIIHYKHHFKYNLISSIVVYQLTTRVKSKSIYDIIGSENIYHIIVTLVQNER